MVVFYKQGSQGHGSQIHTQGGVGGEEPTDISGRNLVRRVRIGTAISPCALVCNSLLSALTLPCVSRMAPLAQEGREKQRRVVLSPSSAASLVSE